MPQFAKIAQKRPKNEEISFKNISFVPFDRSFAPKKALIKRRGIRVFLKAGKGEKMGKSENIKSNDSIKEIAEILANGIIRMKKKGKLK
jgi:hypothetical protein